MEYLYRVIWYESERGYGQKEFYRTYYNTEAEADAAITEHWTEEAKANPTGATPDWYVFPGGVNRVPAAEAPAGAISGVSVPYPEFCRHKDKCAGKSYCQADICCAD